MRAFEDKEKYQCIVRVPLGGGVARTSHLISYPQLLLSKDSSNTVEGLLKMTATPKNDRLIALAGTARGFAVL